MSGNSALLIIVLMHTGQWLSGTNATISVAGKLTRGLPACDVVWQLKAGDTELIQGRASLGEQPRPIQIHVPDVRQRIKLRWCYQLVGKNDAELERGERAVDVWPVKIFDDFTNGFANPVTILERDHAIDSAMSKATVRCTIISDSSKLIFAHGNQIIVAPDAIGPSPFDCPPLNDLAGEGAQIVVFAQPRASRIADYDTARRQSADVLRWRTEHSVLRGFESDMLKEWVKSAGDLQCIELPADEPALEIGWFAPSVMEKAMAPLDALIVEKAIGKGRLIFVQLPIDNWTDDPRALALLNNLLVEISTPPAPTPRPSDRPSTRPLAPTAEKRISIGD